MKLRGEVPTRFYYYDDGYFFVFEDGSSTEWRDGSAIVRSVAQTREREDVLVAIGCDSQSGDEFSFQCAEAIAASESFAAREALKAKRRQARLESWRVRRADIAAGRLPKRLRNPARHTR